MSYVWRIRIIKNQGRRGVAKEIDWLLGILGKHSSSSKWLDYLAFIHTLLKWFLETFWILQAGESIPQQIMKMLDFKPPWTWFRNVIFPLTLCTFPPASYTQLHTC